MLDNVCRTRQESGQVRIAGVSQQVDCTKLIKQEADKVMQSYIKLTNQLKEEIKNLKTMINSLRKEVRIQSNNKALLENKERKTPFSKEYQNRDINETKLKPKACKGGSISIQKLGRVLRVLEELIGPMHCSLRKNKKKYFKPPLRILLRIIQYAILRSLNI